MAVKLKVASFFSGIGGFDLGFENAGMKVVFQCEINSFCQTVLKKHWPKIKIAKDINSLQSCDIPPAEVWCGGFPCQDLSLANQGKRKGLEGERSGLFYKIAEMLEGKLPRWVVLENVPGLLNSHEGKDFQILLQRLDELGYCISWRVLDAKYFGTPQRRRRVFIVGSLGTVGSAEVLFGGEAPEIASRQGCGKRDEISASTRKGSEAANTFAIQHATIGRKHTAGPQAKGYRNDGEAYTLDSRGSGDAVCKANGSFGIRETTGVPQELDSCRYRAVGNAVNVNVIEWLGRKIIKVDKIFYP